tara:strand:+ start:125 stop:388 length:264 start_codon:yes stop_codon:yes gene_type:complete
MSEKEYTVIETYADGSELVVLNIEEEECECLWCGTTKNLKFWVNDAWSVEKLCQTCYDDIEEECDDEGRSFEDWCERMGVEPIGDEE